MSEFYIGLDLGQAADYSALVVVEKVGSDPRGPEPFWMTGDPYLGSRATHIDTPEIPLAVYQIPHIERFPLKTRYPVIVDRVAELLKRPELLGRSTLVVDATGVGKGVVDMLDERNVDHVRVTIHGGDQVVHEGRDYRVPKRDLVGILQVLFQTERLKIGRDLPHAQTLTSELLSFRARISASTGHDSYEAEWREGAHDDLVLATALACWYPESVGRVDVWFA